MLKIAPNQIYALYNHENYILGIMQRSYKRINNPVNQSALHIYHAEEQKKKEAKIKALAKEYGLIYFYRGGCPYCKAFAPVIKEFSAKYNWSVLPVSLDGDISADFPNSRRDNGIAKALNITVVPAVIALHPKSKEQIPLAYGFISQQEMLNRINLLVEDQQ